MRISREQVMEVVSYVLEGHNVTETADHFGKSRKTINNILDLVRKEDGIFYNEILKSKLKLMLEKLLLEARAKAGQKSRRELVFTDEEAQVLANRILCEGKTLRDLASECNCSHTTVANAVRRVIDDDVLFLIQQLYASTPSLMSDKQQRRSVLELLNDESVLSQIQNLETIAKIKALYSQNGRR